MVIDRAAREADQEELITLRQRVADLETERDRMQSIFNAAPVVVYIHDLVEQRSITVNRELSSLLGYRLETYHQLYPDPVQSLMHPADVPRFLEHAAQLDGLRDGKVAEFEYRMRHANGAWVWLLSRDTVFSRDAQGKPTQIVGAVQDITARKQAEEERVQLQEQLIATQESAIRELSTPLIPVSDNAVVMPLVGAIDSGRAQQVMETLLEGVATHHADVVIVDITGVQVVDTQVANSFIRAAQAVKLLGAQVILTGIQPRIAQTLINLGVDLSGIITRSSLQAGMAYGLNGHKG